MRQETLMRVARCYSAVVRKTDRQPPQPIILPAPHEGVGVQPLTRTTWRIVS